MAQPTASTAVAGRAQRDRFAVLAGLILLALLAWGYTVHVAATMRGMAMPASTYWSPGAVGGLAIMWVVMMIAMMVPSAVPAILAFDATSRQRRDPAGATAPTAAFILGYLLPWAAFGTVAAIAQAALHSAALLTPAMSSANPLLGGGLLLAAGIYQWLPLKAGCLEHCRTPGAALAAEWRDGTRGALAMGLRHGLVCVGCCGLLMLLLFVAGVMNLLWVAAIAALSLTEKMVRSGPVIGMVTGAVLAAWGVWVVVAP